MKPNYNYISKYRSQLMGISIISIIILHYFQDTFGLLTINLLLKKLSHAYNAMISSVGVDIFLIVSAVGLYFSYSKNSDFKLYAKRRLCKVAIPYVVLGSIYWFVFDIIIQKGTVIQFFKDLLWVTFFENGDTTYWYIFAILLFYLIFPILNKIINKSKNGTRNMIFLISLDIIFNISLAFCNTGLYKNIEIFLLRVPIFTCGVWLAKKVYEKKEINKKLIFINSIFFIIIEIILICCTKFSINYFLYFKRYLISILAINIVILLPLILECINNKLLNSSLDYIGKYTLELYIFHIGYRNIFKKCNLPTSNIKYEIMMIIITIISSFIFNKICGIFQNKIFDKNYKIKNN